MTGFEVGSLAVVGAWLASLTLVLLLVVRHIGLLAVRLGAGPPQPHDGLMVGEPVPSEAVAVAPELDRELRYLVFLSGNCASCLDVAPRLASASEYPERLLAVLASNGDRSAKKLNETLSEDVKRIGEPSATVLANAFHVHTAPQAIQVENGIVTGKSAFREIDDLRRFIKAYDESDAREIAITAREAMDNVAPA